MDFKNNEKETKEHNMIVDMERNDLSRICKPGSVKLSKQKIHTSNPPPKPRQKWNNKKAPKKI